MRRPLTWAFVIGVILLIIGLVVSTIAPSAGGEIIVIAGAAALGAAAVVALVRAGQTPGWTKAVNPGAARREYRAEQAAKQRGHAKGDEEGR